MARERRPATALRPRSGLRLPVANTQEYHTSSNRITDYIYFIIRAVN